MSRSIGDVYLKKPDPVFQQFGPIPLKRPVLTAEPSIISRKLKPQDLFLIFASDGLWEYLSDEAAVDIVFKNPRAVSAHFSNLARDYESDSKKLMVVYKIKIYSIMLNM